MQKKGVYVNRLKSVIIFYRPEQKIMQKEDPMELNFERYEMPK